MEKIKKLTLKDTAFPQKLRDISSPPQQIFVLGDLEPLLTAPALAVVGSRKVTPYGKQITIDLVEAVAAQGVLIISGLALGVDSVAHVAALNAGGKTIAVLPSGLDKIYPSTHYHLALEILKKGGALVSEYPENSEPYPINFIARNRLVSGLSDGVLITEAATKSGTLHTANFALEQGKTVMAVPGNATSEQSRGTNNLLKTGAVMVTESKDILQALNLNIKDKQASIPLGNTEAESTLLQMIAAGTTDAAVLLAESSLSASEFNQTLTMLEITGKIRALGAGHWGLS